MRASHLKGAGFLAIVFAIGLLASACSNSTASAAAGSNSGLWVKIDSPKPNAKVGEPLTVQLSASVPIGDPSTGDHHVHLCFDGASCDVTYQLAYANTVSVTGLAPGTHTMTASLRNADHSDAGPKDTISFTVTGGAATSPTPATTAGGMAGGSGY